MSAFVYAGSAQMVGLEVWQKIWTPGAILTIMTVTAMVNSRMILLGATLQPWLKPEPMARSALNLFLLTDAGWIFSTRYRNDGGRDVAFLFGTGVALWVLWITSSLTGFLAGAFVPEPRRFGLDLVMPIFFAVMLVPLWKGARQALPWLVAGPRFSRRVTLSCRAICSLSRALWRASPPACCSNERARNFDCQHRGDRPGDRLDGACNLSLPDRGRGADDPRQNHAARSNAECAPCPVRSSSRPPCPSFWTGVRPP